MKALRLILDQRVADTSDQVYVEGGYVDRVPTVPLDSGVAAIVSFATLCHIRVLQHMRAHKDLVVAEAALVAAIAAGTVATNVLIALAAVRAARGKL